MLLAFAGISMWVLGLDAWQVLIHGRTWTGTDGVYIVDQMQYLAWIRDASRHVFAANLFVLRPTPADYFQPAVALSAALSALGVVPWVSLLLWKPVAVLGCFFAVRRYIARLIDGVWARRAALALALFFGSVTVAYGSFTVLGDLFPGFLTWGYTFALLALAAMVAALLAYDRVREEGRVRWLPAILGAIATSLHPWHGELLMVVLIGAELVMWRAQRRILFRLPAVTLIATGMPLLYYAVLGHADISWRLAREASKHSFSVWPILIYLIPLALPAVLAYRGPSVNFLTAATRSWPISALVVFVISATAVGATPLHAFEGITIPLSVLAVQGAGRLRLQGWPQRWAAHPRRRWAIGFAAVALVTVPGTALQLKSARELASPTVDNANFIDAGERQALDYLARQPGPGGVLTRSYLGAVVPSRTGRHTLVGDCLWSQPGCLSRTDIAQQLFAGTLPTPVARDFVRTSGARFVLADCQTLGNLERLLAPLTLNVARFGCASVYEVAASGLPPGPLAESGHAAVRASRRQ
jgi:hypothetical protein